MVKETSYVPRAAAGIGCVSQPLVSLLRNRQSWQSVERYLTGMLTDKLYKNCQTVAAAVAGRQRSGYCIC